MKNQINSVSAPQGGTGNRAVLEGGRRRKKKKISGFMIVTNIVFIAAGLCCLIPLLLVLSISLTEENTIFTEGYHLIPKAFSFESYRYIFSDSGNIIHSYLVSIFVTVVGTVLGLTVTSMVAYPISRKDVKYRNVIAMYLFITMLFNGGLVPSYILITRYLHLKNTIWVMILPMLINAWNVLLMRNFFASGVPTELIESAKLDGLGEFGTFLRIVIPISTPAFATVGLMISIGYWNDWWLALLYVDEAHLMPLQYTLQSILLNIQEMMSDVQLRQSAGTLPSESARMALCVLAVGPIILAYPFLQKYIVKGMTVGAVKG